MKRGQAALQFLADVNVPDSVGRVLTARGHDVARVRDVMAANAPDPVVAEAAIQSSRILLSWDRDFNHQRFMKPRFQRLSRIGFSCSEPEGAARLEAVIDLIEFALYRHGDLPIRIRIGRDKVQVTC